MTALNNFIKNQQLENANFFIDGNSLFIKKWNWEYQECLDFQKKSQAFIQEHRKLKIYIFTNHPHVFTYGRGNERGAKGLEPLTEEQKKYLSYPLYNIHRGGGLTFHYPGQWIFYPIVAINQSYSLEDHSKWLLNSVCSVLKEDFKLTDVITATKLMGVWKNKRKLASIGVGLSKFVTEHGLALNLKYDKSMFQEINKINPCGMSPTTYTTVDQFSSDPDLLENFHSSYLENIFNL